MKVKDFPTVKKCKHCNHYDILHNGLCSYCISWGKAIKLLMGHLNKNKLSFN